MCAVGSDEHESFIELRPLVVAHLAQLRYAPADMGWMPGTEVAHVPQFAGAGVLSLGDGNSPASHWTLGALAFGDGGGIQQIAQLKDAGDGDLLAQQLLGKSETIQHGAAVDGHLHELWNLLGNSGYEQWDWCAPVL